MFETEFDFAHV